MSGILSRVGRFFGKNAKTFVGKDLEGNSYYELPAVNGGRMKRVVEYRVARDVADYTSGTNRLPIQWTAWLSHTRTNPPSLPELQQDSARRQDLLSKIAEIEARETAERIRQGYLPDPNAESSTTPRQIPSPSDSPTTTTEMGTIGRPGIAGPSRYPSAPPGPRQNPLSPSDPALDPPSKVSSPDIAAPRPLVDPSSASSGEELRRLAEEDTKRRIAETARAPPPADSPAPADVSAGGGLKPRRRGAAAK